MIGKKLPKKQRGSTNKYEFSIIITTFQRSDTLRDVLADLAAQTYAPENFEVLIYNDGADQETKKIVSSFKMLNISYLESRQRIRGATSRNQCKKRAEGKFLIFLDDDVRLSPDFLENVEADSREFNAFCYRVQSPSRVSGLLLNRLINRFAFGKVSLLFGQFLGLFSQGPKKTCRVDHFPGCFFCCEAELAKDIWFDEYIGEGTGYLDDLAFTLQLSKKTPLMYIGTRSITHLGASAGGYREKDLSQFYYYYWNHKAHVIRKFGSSLFLFSAFLPNFFEAVVISIIKKKNCIPVFFRGWIDGSQSVQKT